MGATVTKIEPPGGDSFQSHCPAWYAELHRKQKIVNLDLKSQEGQTKLDELLKDSHLFITSLRPAALKKLGLDTSTLHRLFPRLHLIQIQGYPSPNENSPSHDLNCQAEAGLLSPPSLPRALFTDFAVAERVLSLSLLALLKSARGEPATSTLVCMSEITQELAIPLRMGLTAPEGPLGGALPHYNVYRCKDGWIAVAAIEPHFLERLLALLKLSKPSQKDFEEAFLLKTRSEWEHLAEKSDIPLSKL
jgi:crotonobetainyl-CoA:carnitine CoA-transferase CaiB-like acyl-CoA transferase